MGRSSVSLGNALCFDLVTFFPLCFSYSRVIEHKESVFISLERLLYFMRVFSVHAMLEFMLGNDDYVLHTIHVLLLIIQRLLA